MERRITAHSPNAYKRLKPGPKGPFKAVSPEEVRELRSQGYPWIEVAHRVGITYSALYCRVRRWRKAGIEV